MLKNINTRVESNNKKNQEKGDGKFEAPKQERKLDNGMAQTGAGIM